MSESNADPVVLTEYQLNTLAGTIVKAFLVEGNIFRSNTLEERAFRIYIENIYWVKDECLQQHHMEKLESLARKSFHAAKIFEEIAQQEKGYFRY